MNIEDDQSGELTASSYFLPKRNVMLIQADFGPVYMDMYLHFMQFSLGIKPPFDGMLKDAIAAYILHSVTRPRDEITAWTINLRDPLMNLFVTGDATTGTVTGRIFTENVKATDTNLFYSQVSKHPLPPRQSVVQVEGDDILKLTEQFYEQSEQLPARFFRMDGDEVGMLAGMPDCDRDWLDNLSGEDLLDVGDKEHTDPLDSRRYHFECGCTLDKIFPALSSIARQDMTQIFGDGDDAEITCPRCAAKFVVTRDEMAVFLGDQKG